MDCIGFAQEQVEKSSGAENNLWIPYNDGKDRVAVQLVASLVVQFHGVS